MSNDLKVGDYIRGSHRGIHQILVICNHWPKQYTQLEKDDKWVITKQILTSEFTKPRNNNRYEGALSCCRRITPADLQQELDDITKKYYEAMELISK